MWIKGVGETTRFVIPAAAERPQAARREPGPMPERIGRPRPRRFRIVALFGKGSVWTPMRTIGFNLSGHPALMLPMGFSDGLPLGMQIVGRHYGEARICQIGDAFERATDFSTQRPPQPPR